MQFNFGLHLTTESSIFNLHLHNKINSLASTRLRCYFPFKMVKLISQLTQQVFHYNLAGISTFLCFTTVSGGRENRTPTGVTPSWFSKPISSHNAYLHFNFCVIYRLRSDLFGFSVQCFHQISLDDIM